jgi:protein-tyrosine phosphatase
MLPVTEMPSVPGFEVPGDLYCVAREPAPLFGMPFPSGRSPADWQSLHDAGVRAVLCLHGDSVPYDPRPLEIAGAMDLEDLVGGGVPTDPERELARIREAVSFTRERLERGEGVVVHCIGGRGRTGTVLGCVLVRLGFGADGVVRYLDELHRGRGKAGWPESEWQHEIVLERQWEPR